MKKLGKKLILLGCIISFMFLSVNCYSQGIDDDTCALWHFDEAEGTTVGIIDSAGVAGANCADAGRSITASANYAETDENITKFDNTAVLNSGGSNGFFTTPDSNDFDWARSSTEAWTIDFWARLHTLYTVTPGYIWAHFDPATGKGENIYIHTDETVSLQTYCTAGTPWTGFTGVMTSSSLQLNTWAHIAMVIDNGTASSFFNGAQEGYDDSMAVQCAGENQTGYIGNNSSQTRPFTGNIDEFRIQNSNYFGVTLGGSCGGNCDFTPPTVAYSIASTRNRFHMVGDKNTSQFYQMWTTKFVKKETGGYDACEDVRESCVENHWYTHKDI